MHRLLLFAVKVLPQKLRSGLPKTGVEGVPETGRPLDPEPGLGGID
jgi:hypothetical protein